MYEFARTAWKIKQKKIFVWDKVVQLYSVENDHFGVREILCIEVHRVIAEIKTFLRWISF